MVLESTVILVDNSEYQRNGDYFPNRMSAQKDSINFICQSRSRSNTENDIALISSAEPCQVICTLTTDNGPIFRKLYDLQAKGEMNLMTAIKIGHLALKHRQAKHHKMRIIAFVGSPLELADTHDFQQLAKRLKKEKVNVDFVSFGGYTKNDPMLSEFIEILNGKNAATDFGSHFLVVPRGAELVRALIQSPILGGENRVGALSVEALEFGFDPEEDPELAFALRISREEEEQRQRLTVAGSSTDQNQTDANRSQNSQSMTAEEAELERVLSASSNIYGYSNEMTEDEEIAYALRLSMGMDETEDMTDNFNASQNSNNQNENKKK